ADGKVLSFVSRVTKTSFPVPSLEVIGNPSHFTSQSDVEKLVPVSEFFTPWTGIIDATEPDPGGYRNGVSVYNNSRVPNCERIERVLNWHTEAEWATRPYGRISLTVNTVNSVEWIRRKWNSSQRCII